MHARTIHHTRYCVECSAVHVELKFYWTIYVAWNINNSTRHRCVQIDSRFFFCSSCICGIAIYCECHLKLFIIISCLHNRAKAYWMCMCNCACTVLYDCIYIYMCVCVCVCVCVCAATNLKAKLETTTFFATIVRTVQYVVEKNLICANIQVFIRESTVSMHVFCDRMHWIVTQFIWCMLRFRSGNSETKRWHSNENIIYTPIEWMDWLIPNDIYYLRILVIFGI